MASQRANPVWIGAFVLGAVAITVAAVLVLGSGRFFRESIRWVIYFDSSVVGLDVGAPVVFHGVRVGSVVEIYAYVNPDEKVFETPVYIEIVRGSVRSPTRGDERDVVALVQSWIREDGFRAQLKSQSLITGKLYVDLDFHPDAPLELTGLDPSTPEIPPVPTQLEEIERSLRSAMDRLAELPIEEIAENLRDALGAANRLLDDPKLESAIANLDGTLAELRSVLAKLDGSYDALDAELRETLERARDTLVSIERAVDDAREIVEPGSAIQYQLITTLEEVSAASRSLRMLSESLTDDPNQLIFGRRTSEDSQ